MRILFITRKFPPSVGGMETAAKSLYGALKDGDDKVCLAAWGGSNKWLPAVYLWLFCKSLTHALAHRPDVIYLQDGVMAPLGWLLKLLTRRPTVVTIHGLEVRYKNPAYRRLVLPFISRQTALIAVSEETKKAIAGAFCGVRVDVIHNGLSDVFYTRTPRMEQLQTIAEETGLPLQRLQHSRLLVTTGRLVPRKGVDWFVDSVVPVIVKDDQDLLYLVAGAGSQRAAIERTISCHTLEDRVELLGQVSGNCLRALYNVADIFVMPNVPVPNDIEGFGLVAVEAASCGALVVASDMEGIRDAIADGKNGYLVPAEDTTAFASVIGRELVERTLPASAVRHYTLLRYSWTETARAYKCLFEGTGPRGRATLP